MKRTFRLGDARPDARREVQDELDFHLAMRTREFVEQGMTEDAARQAALASFGDVPGITRELTEARGDRQQQQRRREWWEDTWQDVRVTLRGLRRRPLFAAATVFALALGMGAAGSVYAVVNGVLLRPLPYADPSALAMVWLQAPPSRGGDRWPLSSGFYELIRTRTTTLASTAAFRSWPYAFGDADVVEQVAGARVTPSLFTTLGVRPLLGRTFTDAEGRAGGAAVAVISHALWQGRLGSDPRVIGRLVTLSGQRVEVIGVMPPGFAFPRGAELMKGLQFGARTDVWTPLAFTAADLQNYGTQNLASVARLRPGVMPAQAHDDVQRVVSTFLREAGIRFEMGSEVLSLRDQAAQPVRRGLWLLLAAVVAVLLIACANVAGLVGARQQERAREWAVRQALGARRGRVTRQLVTEMAMLALAGAVLGTLLTVWGARLLVALAPIDLPRADDVRVGGSVLLAIATVAGLSGLAFAGMSARGLGRGASGAAAALQLESVRTTASRGAQAGRRLLVSAQVALSVLLLVGAGLLLRSYGRLQAVRPGFVPGLALVGQVAVPLPAEVDAAREGPGWARFFDEVLRRVREVPGVVAAGAASALPLTGTAEGASFVIVGREPPRMEDAPRTSYVVTTPDYFTAAGIALRTGRAFAVTDNATSGPVAMVSRSLADRNFPGGAIGQFIRCSCEFTGEPPAREIIGVVDDVKFGSLDGETGPAVYLPESQMAYPRLTLVVRTRGPALSALPGVRAAVRAVNPAVALSDVGTLADILRRSLARQRFTLGLLGTFAALALLLAVVGLYGVIAMTVQARRHELGVRLALGARPASLVFLVVREGMQLAGAGVVVGVAGALGLAGLLRALLYGVSARDAMVYSAAVGVTLVVALIASWVPARRAARGSPVEALRVE